MQILGLVPGYNNTDKNNMLMLGRQFCVQKQNLRYELIYLQAVV